MRKSTTALVLALGVASVHSFAGQSTAEQAIPGQTSAGENPAGQIADGLLWAKPGVDAGWVLEGRIWDEPGFGRLPERARGLVRERVLASRSRECRTAGALLDERTRDPFAVWGHP